MPTAAHLWLRRAGSRLGQQIIEYAVLFAAIAAALTAMFLYGKRGIQAVVRESAIKTIGGQVNSAPLADPNQPFRSNATTETFSGGTNTANMMGPEIVYVYDDSSVTNGTSVSVSDQESNYPRHWVSAVDDSGPSGDDAPWWSDTQPWPW